MIRDFSQTDTLDPSRLLANHQADLYLCFRGTERDGQVVRISANKCTIGSSLDCTLQLICPGVRPVHCLIIRGDGGMAIRRLSEDTLLNGKSFGDATLLPGDHLSIGPIEFDVLPEVPRAESSHGSDVTQVHVIADDPAPASSRAENHLPPATDRITCLEQTIVQQQNETHSLLRKIQRLTDQIDETQQQGHASRPPSPQQMGQHADARGTGQELEARFGEQSKVDNQDRSTWVTKLQQIAMPWQEASRKQQDEIQQNLEISHAETGEMEQRSCEPLDHEQELSRQQQEFDQARVELDGRVPEREGKCEPTRQDLAHAHAEFDSQRADWEVQRAEEQERLDQMAGKLEQESAVWQQEREQLNEDSAELETLQKDALDELTQQVESLRAQRDEARDQRAETQRKWQDRQSDMENQLADTRPQIDLYEQANQSLSDQLNAARTRLRQFEDRQQDQQSQEDEIRQSQAQCDGLTQELEETRQHRDQQEQTRQSLNTELDIARARLQEFESQNLDDKSWQEEIQQLRTREDELTQELEEARQQKDRQEQAYQSLRNELNAAQVRLQEFESVVETQFENVTRELEVAQHDRAQEQAEHEAARQDTPREDFDVSQTQDWIPQRRESSQQLDAKESDLPELSSQRQHEQNEAEEQPTSRPEIIDEQGEQLRQAQGQLEQAQRELESSEKAVEDEVAAAVASQRREWEQESEQRQVEFDQSRVAFAAQREKWESQRTQQHNELEDQRERLDREFDELRQLGESLRQQRTATGASGEQERQEQRQLMDPESDAHTNQAAHKGNLSSQPTIVNDVTVPETVDDRLPPVRSESLSGAGETEQTDSTADDNPTLVSEAPRADDELTFSEPTETAPVNTAEILARFGHSIENDEPDIPGPEPTPSVEHHELSSSNPDDEDNDALKVYGEADSIQDYMAELLQRVENGARPTPASAVTEVSEPSEGKISTIDEAAPEVDPAMATIPLDPSEFVPRAVAPEATSNLQALRAVANTSARSAIDKHQRQRFEQLALILWGVAALALMLGGAMLWWVDDFFSFPAFAAMASLCAGAFAAVSALMYTTRAKFASRPVPKMLSEKEVDTAMDVESDQENPAVVMNPSGAPATPDNQPTDLPPANVETARPRGTPEGADS